MNMAYFHDFFRVLRYLRKGVTSREFYRLMTVAYDTAMARLRGWVDIGVVKEVEEDGVKRYYLVSPCFEVVGFGRIYVGEDYVDVKIYPDDKFLRRVRRGEVTIRVLGEEDCAGSRTRG